MRFLTGLIFGVLLTIGTAYVFDASHKGEDENGAGTRRMVNWDVVQSQLKGLSTTLEDGWAHVGGRKQE